MALDKQRVEEFEEKYKKALFSKIDEVSSKQFESINLMITNARNIGQANVDIPNASTTLNNKLVELSQNFKNAGISMFSSELEDYDIVSSSFLGDAIIQDLIDKLSKSNEELIKYNKTMQSVSERKGEQVQALQNISQIKKFLLKIRAIFVSAKPVDFSLTNEEQNELDAHLQEYRDIDDEIYNYNLEDNLVHALVKAITAPQKIGNLNIPHRYDAYAVPRLLEENVIPDLKKLGLEQLIPQLKEALIEEYKKDLPDPEIYQLREEDMYLYVPNFDKESNGRQRNTEVNLKELPERPLKENGISLEDLALIDKTVNASSRQKMTKAIQGELYPAKENIQERKVGTTDISLE